ncbi:Hint domain-containing protein [Rhodobacteraceae bacterium KMM 6894]|nr:Hint domain-containing protein [Rhodobacteraceae bacterium KMM 6894]
MNHSPVTASFIQTLSVYRASAISVVNGANLGDGMSFAAELDLDDTYELHALSVLEGLSVTTARGGVLSVADDSQLGRAGHAVHLDSCLTMMTANGTTAELLILVEVDAAGDVDATYVMPLAQLTPRMEYTLVGIDTDGQRAKFAEVACVSFSRGTHVTTASGAQKKVEDLRAGDMILTRDDGAQRLLWVGASTVRAVGDFAPVCIRADALHNSGDLVVSPDNRLFIYQRSDALGAGRHEVLVRARHLVNGGTIVQQDGGFIDYFQLLFDDHQIIYAEGIACETLLVDPRTRPALPRDLTDTLAQTLPGHPRRAHLDFEISESLLELPDAAAILRRASTR